MGKLAITGGSREIGRLGRRLGGVLPLAADGQIW